MEYHHNRSQPVTDGRWIFCALALLLSGCEAGMDPDQNTDAERDYREHSGYDDAVDCGGQYAGPGVFRQLFVYGYIGRRDAHVFDFRFDAVEVNGVFISHQDAKTPRRARLSSQLIINLNFTTRTLVRVSLASWRLGVQQELSDLSIASRGELLSQRRIPLLQRLHFPYTRSQRSSSISGG